MFRKTKEDPNKYTFNLPVSEELIFIKIIENVPKLIYRFNTIYQNLNFLCQNFQADPKIHWEMQMFQKSQNSPKKEQNNFRTHNQATVIKSVVLA